MHLEQGISHSQNWGKSTFIAFADDSKNIIKW